jgi:protein-disulfide isomerase
MNRQDRMTKREMSKREALREKRRKEKMRNRGLLIGGIIVVSVIFAVILITSSLKTAKPETFTMITPAVVPNPQGISMGDPNAPIKVTEFADFQCPGCMLFATQQESGFVAKYVTTGKVYFTYRSFSFLDHYDTRTPALKESHAAAEAAYCASDQNKFWEYHDILYANQGAENSGAFTDSRLSAFAQALNLNMSTFKACYTSGKYRQEVLDDYALGTKYGLVQTPSFLINGVLVIEADLITTIESQLTSGTPTTAAPASGSTTTAPAASPTP